MSHRRKILISLQRHCKVPARICTAFCFVAIVVALACSLPRSSTPIVHAYSSKSKDSGATLFHEKGCEHCHGVNGHGGDLPDEIKDLVDFLHAKRKAPKNAAIATQSR